MALRRTGNQFQASIWPGFVDAMTGLLLVLMFVLTIFMVVQFVLRETISGQASELDALSAEVAALAQALGLAQDKNTALTSQVGELTATLGDAQSQQEQQLALIAALRSEREAQEQALTAAQAQIVSFEEQVAGLLSEREINLGNIAELEVTRDALLTEQEQLNLALAGLRDEIDLQSEAARLAAARREALEALITDLRRRYSESQAEQLTLNAQVAELETQLTDEEAARLAEAAAAEALRKELEGAQSELTAMTLALEEQRRKAEETLTLLAAAEAAGEDLDIQLAAALLAQDLVEDQLLTAQASLLARDDEIAALQGQVSEAQDLLKEAETGGAALATRLRSVEAALAASLADAEGTGDELAQLRLKLSEAEAQAVAEADRLGANIKSLEERLADALAAKTAAESDAVDNAGLIAGLKTQLVASQEELKSIRRQLAEVLAANEAAEAQAMAAEDVRQQLAAALAARAAAENQTQVASQEVDDLRSQLSAALAAKLAAEEASRDKLTDAEQREILLAQARDKLAEQQAQATKAQKQTELLNQQVAELNKQLAMLQSLLDDSKAREVAADVQIQALGQDLNLALARAAAEERRRRKLEEEETKRLEEEKLALEAEKQDLEKYRSEFFGRLRDVLGGQEGVRIVGDRFVFSSEVLFAPGEATLSRAGELELAKVASILREVAGEIPQELDWVLQIDGHTDNVPLIGGARFADNWELSQARALSVVRYMINFLGFDPKRLSANGFGEYQPINPGDSAEARAQNRRIELKFTEK